ncbi:hypothetical protein EVAR_68105_1 [Eumeta japonica]|uniref:Uncharacterized protein n=1 Tax=Eumeta variegata TaxID=151549 RepID=A0A4C1ZEL4_EUMVA|nr:hypothetical protein EVAR_68105_1 [Eumeta japonica]
MARCACAEAARGACHREPRAAGGPPPPAPLLRVLVELTEQTESVSHSQPRSLFRSLSRFLRRSPLNPDLGLDLYSDSDQTIDEHMLLHRKHMYIVNANKAALCKRRAARSAGGGRAHFNFLVQRRFRTSLSKTTELLPLLVFLNAYSPIHKTERKCCELPTSVRALGPPAELASPAYRVRLIVDAVIASAFAARKLPECPGGPLLKPYSINGRQ